MIGFAPLAAEVLEACKTHGWRVATAESCTGGMIAAALTDIPGSSAVVDRGFVTYSYPAKTAMLDVPPEMLREHGAVSEAVARQMALGALEHSDADMAIAVTGVAGPGADGDKPEGLVWFGVASEYGVETSVQHFGPLGRDAVRMATVKVALDLLLATASRSTLA